MDWSFFFEVLIGGLLAGIMYSLVALGFVLIYKASGVFNFAQGWGLAGAAAATLGVMVVLAFFVERVVLRPLVNQPPIALFMATIGLAFLIEGFAQGILGAQVHGLDIGIPDVPLEVRGVHVSQLDL